MKVIDFKTQFLSHSWFQALAARSPLSGTDPEKLARAAKRAGLELPPAVLEDHVARWIHEIERHGVDHVVTWASGAQELDDLGEAATLSEGRLVPFACIDPTSNGAPERAATLVRERGFHGVVLSPARDRYELGDARVAEVLDAIDGCGASVIVQCGLTENLLGEVLGISDPLDLRRADPLAVVPLASARPRTPFVVSALGGGFFRETLLAGAQCSNVWVDTAHAEHWMKTQARPQQLADVCERVLGVFGPERVLFATGSGPFPAGWRHDRRTALREAFGACGLRREDMESLFGGNAARLLKLDVTAANPAAARPRE